MCDEVVKAPRRRWVRSSSFVRFFRPGLLLQDGLDFVGVRIGAEAEDALDLAFADVLFHAPDKAIEGGLRRVGDEAEHRGIDVVLDGFEDPGHEGFAEGHALAVDVRVVATGEVDPLEAARGAVSGDAHFFDLDGAVALHDEPLAGLQFLDLGRGGIEGRLDDGAFRGGDHHLVVLVPEAGADAVGVAGDEGVPGADDAPHDVTAVPIL